METSGWFLLAFCEDLMLKLWLQWKSGKLSEKQYLVEKNILLGQKIDKIRLQRSGLKVRIQQIESEGVKNG